MTQPTIPSITNHTIRAMHGALSVLGNRRMATANGDLKVGRMLRAVVAFAEPLQKARQRVVLDVLDGREIKDLSPLEVRRIEAEIMTKQAELDEQAAPDDFKLPSGQIETKDLPKEMSGDEGWQNATALGAITADLGPLFDFGEE